MSDPGTCLYLDLIDPGSYLMDLRVEEASRPVVAPPVRAPFEIRPPTAPMLHPDDAAWRSYFERMAAELGEAGHTIKQPRLIPWTRKAHEFVAWAGETEPGSEARVRGMLFRRFLEEGEDIGRIDVLLEVAAEVGFDVTGAKAALDVDRHAETVADIRARALAKGVRGVPTLVRGSQRLEGIHDEGAIRALLRNDR